MRRLLLRSSPARSVGPVPRSPAGGRIASVRRALRRRRRLLLALVLSTLAVPVLIGFAPASTATVSVVVAARDLPAGAMLSADDLGTATVAASLAPRAALHDAAPLVGSRTRGAVAAGSAITPSMLADTAGRPHPPGTAVIPIPLHSALVSDLTAGSRIALIIADPADPRGTGGRRIDATVVEKPVVAGGSGPAAFGSSDSSATVLVAVREPDLLPIARATGTGALTVAMVD